MRYTSVWVPGQVFLHFVSVAVLVSFGKRLAVIHDEVRSLYH